MHSGTDSDNAKNIILKTENLTRRFKNGDGELYAVNDINLEIYAGELLAITGESGSGKSTLLNLLGGMDSATEGDILFRGESISKMNSRELTLYRRNNIGFVFQDYNLMPNLNIRQNLNLIGELVSDPENADDILKLVGLENKKYSYPSELSGGQQQRVSIARALVKRPAIILADEPTAALDYDSGIEVLTAFEKVVENGTTLIMVTHNNEITKMADRTVRIQNGRVAEIVENKNKLHAGELTW